MYQVNIIHHKDGDTSYESTIALTVDIHEALRIADQWIDTEPSSFERAEDAYMFSHINADVALTAQGRLSLVLPTNKTITITTT